MADQVIQANIRDLAAPGDILAEALEERGMSNADLARRAELSEKHVSQLVNAKVPLSSDVALKLEQVLNIPASFWLNLESNFRTEQKRAAQKEQLKSFVPWLRHFNYREMVSLGYLRDAGSDRLSRVEAMLRFFGVTSEDAWASEWGRVTARFRKSPSFEPNRYALTAWLRRSEVEAQSIRCAPFNAGRFHASLAEVRKLTAETPDVFVPKLQELCANAGVAVVFVPALPKLAVSGATRWVGPDKALISLSLRHKSDDQLWFSFFHEACHVLEHKTSAIYIDSAAGCHDDPEEERANRFARDTLIPAADFQRISRSFVLRLDDIAAFAAEIGVAPGIVVGRLQHERLLKFSQGNKLKVRFEWKQTPEGEDPQA